jgi:asparagine synthase (glutamine-hydrolysing)
VCGFVGWVDFQRDLTSEDAVVASMATTLAPRGPDGSGRWLETHAALTHHRLAVIDIGRGEQPMRLERDGSTVAVIVYSGELYNYRDLRRTLQRLGESFRTESDTEVVLRAFDRWGDRAPEKFDGMFAFAVWDRVKREVTLVRDRLGIKPLFYVQRPGMFLFASEQKALLAHPDITPVLRADGLIESIELIKTPGHGIFDGIRELPPGHLLRFGQREFRPEPFWQLKARPGPSSFASATASTRGLLERVVSQQVSADVPIGALLSGGLDSSIVASLMTASSTEPLRTFSVAVGDRQSMSSHDDEHFVELMAADLRSHHRTVTLSAESLMSREHRRAVVRALDAPISRGDFDTSLYMLMRAIRTDCTVALSGEGSDELFGGYDWFSPTGTVDSFPWFAPDDEARYRMLSPELLTLLDADAYRADAFSSALAAVPTMASEPVEERRARELTHLHLTRFLPALLDRKDRLSMACGLEVRVPFCHHELVEAIFNVPWSIRAARSRPKALLQAAAADLVPAAITSRAKRPYPVASDGRYEAILRAEVREVVADRTRPVTEYLNRAAVEQALQSQNPGYAHRAGLEFVLAFDDWFSIHRPQIAV